MPRHLTAVGILLSSGQLAEQPSKGLLKISFSFNILSGNVFSGEFEFLDQFIVVLPLDVEPETIS